MGQMDISLDVITRKGVIKQRFIALCCQTGLTMKIEEAGAVWTHDRAATACKRILDEHQPPEIDPGIKEELEGFVARRVEEGGAPTDY